MKRSLSVFLPFYNGQARVAPLVSRVVELVPELTPRFDVVIIDDGSTDATSEVAHELALFYPQVHMVTHPARWGRGAAMRTGLLHSSGEIILFGEDGCRLDLAGLCQLWEAVRAFDLVWTRAPDPPASFRRPMAPGLNVKHEVDPQPGLQIIRRRALDDWRRAAADDDWQGYLLREGYRCQSLGVRCAEPASADRQLLRGDLAGRRSRRPKRPNYLARLRAFAWGE